MNLNRSHNAASNPGFGRLAPPAPSAPRSPRGLLARLGRLLGMTDPEPQREPILITVWDARRDRYRHVNLLNTHDPLWNTAHALATLRNN